MTFLDLTMSASRRKRKKEKIYLTRTWRRLFYLASLFLALAKFAFRDYREIPQLDTYDLGDLDEETYSPIDVNVRRNAEEVMRRRDREQTRQQGRARIPSAFLDIDMGMGIQTSST